MRIARRRLPTYQELASCVRRRLPGALAPGGELTAERLPASRRERNRPSLIIVVDQAGNVDTVPDTFAGGKGFRCVANPVNG